MQSQSFEPNPRLEPKVLVQVLIQVKTIARIEIPGQIRSGKLVIPELPMWGYFNWTRTDKCIFVTGQDRFQMG